MARRQQVFSKRPTPHAVAGETNPEGTTKAFQTEESLHFNSFNRWGFKTVPRSELSPVTGYGNETELAGFGDSEVNHPSINKVIIKSMNGNIIKTINWPQPTESDGMFNDYSIVPENKIDTSIRRLSLADLYTTGIPVFTHTATIGGGTVNDNTIHDIISQTPNTSEFVQAKNERIEFWESDIQKNYSSRSTSQNALNTGWAFDNSMNIYRNKVHKVRIENNGSENGNLERYSAQWYKTGGRLSLADIKVFDEFNTSLITPSNEIIEWNDDWGDPLTKGYAGFDADKCIDGNLNTYNISNYSVWKRDAWIELILTTPSFVSNIEITNNNDGYSWQFPTRIKFLDINDEIIETCQY